MRFVFFLPIRRKKGQKISVHRKKFTDYLNFFEFIVFLKTSKQLKNSEIEVLFGYYFDCLNRHQRVKQYIADPENGYEGLAEMLATRT